MRRPALVASALLLVAAVAACVTDDADDADADADDATVDADRATTAAGRSTASTVSTATPAAPSRPGPTSAPGAPSASLPRLADPPQLSDDTLGLSGTLVQYRLQEPRHLMSVKVANDGPRDVRIETLRFVWPAMEPTGPVRHDYTVAAGSATDLAVPVGASICTSPPTAGATLPDVPMAAEAVVDGRRVVFPVDDQQGAAARIYRRDCDRQTVEHGIELSFDDWSPPGADTPSGEPLVTAALVVRRRAATGDVAVTRIQGSVNISAVRPSAISVGADDAGGRGVVEFTNSRCDPHGMSDTSKPYELLVTVEVDGHEVTVPMTPDATGRRALVDGLFRRCDPAGG